MLLYSSRQLLYKDNKDLVWEDADLMTMMIVIIILLLNGNMAALVSCLTMKTGFGTYGHESPMSTAQSAEHCHYPEQGNYAITWPGEQALNGTGIDLLQAGGNDQEQKKAIFERKYRWIYHTITDSSTVTGCIQTGATRIRVITCNSDPIL